MARWFYGDPVYLERCMESARNMEHLTVDVPSIGLSSSFPMEPQNQHRFLNGLDDIGITLTHARAIDEFERRRPRWLSRA